MSQINTCRISGEKFTVLDEEIAFCESHDFPLPDLSPDERIRHLMAFRNEWKLYPRKCDATGENILSAYAPGVPFPVYKNEVWWADTWEALDYGRDFDFSRSFFEQFGDLQKVVPREGTSVFNSENSVYNSHLRQSKNCYLNSLVAHCEDMYYSYWMVRDKDVMDSMYTNNSTLCYECSDVDNCYHCFSLQESNNCQDCHFSYQLRGCNNCIFCSNLANKSYHIFNKPVSKEEFNAFQEKLLNGSYATWAKAYQDFLEMRGKTIHRNLHNLNSENVTGDHIKNSKHCLNCLDAVDSEDCFNAGSVGDSKNVYSTYSAGWPACEVIYNCAVVRGSTDLAFCNYCWFSNNLRYCDSCVSCKDCFGCIGLRHKQYCILNKQYTKEEYETLLAKVIQHMEKSPYPLYQGGKILSSPPDKGPALPVGGELKGVYEWGQFFPAYLSPFGYNETCAIDFYPLSKAEAVKMGFQWSEYETPKPQVKKVLNLEQMQKLPDNVKDIPDDILDWALTCEASGKLYRIIKPELKFYREQQLPIPRRHPEQRHKDRMALRNPRRLWERNCPRCGNKMLTTYAPERKERVYCEECFRKEVY